MLFYQRPEQVQDDEMLSRNDLPGAGPLMFFEAGQLRLQRLRMRAWHALPWVQTGGDGKDQRRLVSFWVHFVSSSSLLMSICIQQ
ncbi:hypothetical protein BHE74_00041971 [Ensete ventricosum]|nr:hypothetical protein BHE74_00041971 [Ensete ventricosum]